MASGADTEQPGHRGSKKAKGGEPFLAAGKEGVAEECRSSTSNRVPFWGSCKIRGNSPLIRGLLLNRARLAIC